MEAQTDNSEAQLQSQIDSQVYTKGLLLQIWKAGQKKEPASVSEAAESKDEPKSQDADKEEARITEKDAATSAEAPADTKDADDESKVKTMSLVNRKDSEAKEARRLAREERKAKRAAETAAAAAALDEQKVKIALSQELGMQKEAANLQAEYAAAMAQMAWDPAAYYFGNGAMAQMTYPQLPPQYCTTVMLRNIPNKYTRDMLCDQLNVKFKNQYDFLYLPIDFTSSCNVGYAFINFRTPAICQQFVKSFNGVKTKNCLPGFNSAKVCQVTYARVQGRQENMENLCDQTFVDKLIEHPMWQPLFYDDDGKLMPFKATEGSSRKKSKGMAGASPSNGPSSPPAAPHMSPLAPSIPLVPYGAVPLVHHGYPPGAHLNGPYSPYASMMPGLAPPAMGFHEIMGIPRGGGSTLMLRNIPNKYTRSMLLEVLNKHFKGAFDFLYLPIDFSNRCNVGYAFINFRNSVFVQKFREMFHNVQAKQCLPGFNSQKVCEVSVARVQTLESNLDHFRQNATRLLSEHPDWQPLLFDMNGDPLPFPALPTMMNAEAQEFVPTSGNLPDVPQSALDSRALEFKMQLRVEDVKGFLDDPDGDGEDEDVGDKEKSNKDGAPRSQVRSNLLKNQVEFYFSVDNLCSDLFLRSNMDADGWVSLNIIIEFKKMRQLGGSAQEVATALAGSENIEVSADSKSIRLKDGKLRENFRQVPTEYVSKSPTSKSQGLGLDDSGKGLLDDSDKGLPPPMSPEKEDSKSCSNQ